MEANHDCNKKFIVEMDCDGADHPHHFSKKKKLYIAMTVGFSMFNSTISSSLPGGASPEIAAYFKITDPVTKILPSTTYLIGYVVGPLCLAPMSEQFGRRNLLLCTSSLFFTMSLGCTLSPTFTSLLIFRFLSGVGGSAPISVIGGVYADIFDDPGTRGTATAAYTITTTIGTVLGPTIFGYIAYYDWRWSFALTTVLGAIASMGLYFLPETYVPYLLHCKVKTQRSHCSKSCRAYVSTQELDSPSMFQVLLQGCSRPAYLLFTEAIVLFSSLYCSLVFAILFLLFSAYAYIFRQVYNMDYRTAGLAFVPMAAGTLLSFPLCMAYDRYRELMRRRGAPWTFKEEYRRLPLACIGGILLVISLFWLAWTSTRSVHWIAPMLSGLPFGIALNLILVALFNYLTDSYGTFAANALAAASCSRSIVGAVLPLAEHKMYTSLGIGWATSTLAFASLALVPVPFVFLFYGPEIRKNSKFCRSSSLPKDDGDGSRNSPRPTHIESHSLASV